MLSAISISPISLSPTSILFDSTGVGAETVPYLIGSTEIPARQRIESIYCIPTVTGSGGSVVSQIPAAFSVVTRGTRIFITMGGALNNARGSRRGGLAPYQGREGT